MFHLSKWYCDCVSDDGTAFIGYWARVRWGLAVLPYAATIVKLPGEAAHERCTLVPCREPVRRRGELHWESRRAGVRALWKARIPGHTSTLLSTREGSIDWECWVPSAECRVQLADGRRISGLGYAEHLRLTLRPWQLPLEELRWGRFLSARDALTWIEWDGPQARRWIFYNGSELGTCMMAPGRIDLSGDQGVLELAHPVVLREGALLAGTLRAVPWASLFLRGSLRHAEEVKWLARGSFVTPTGTSLGWAIHEVVRVRRGEPC